MKLIKIVKNNRLEDNQTINLKKIKIFFKTKHHYFKKKKIKIE